ncbi:MAG: maleylpyruvate isomerase N-terminal domain-containing protein [Actinomycetota bacterium]|nr:maleylpyruvate isomerase N-terminal domain-containing protein [Actinomycetota bacterium]MDQ3681055.1 maleylpyruvate isomerase N-terminal domain-containing protein [Actinomycetota bacterium]
MRNLYLEVATVTSELVADPSVADHWEEQSVLAQFAVGGLAGHLARSILQVEWYLDGEVADAPPMTASGYYASLVGVTDPDSELNTGVRRRGEEVASEGPAGLAARTAGALTRLTTRLPAEPGDRRVEAAGRVLLLDEYLRTRLVEMTVHIDDLALSVGLRPPEAPAGAYGVAIETLVGVSTLRHGPLAVLRALTRHERQGTEILRVL